MKTVQDLIAVLQTLPPETRVAHFDVYPELSGDAPRLYYAVFEDGPMLWTEYDNEQAKMGVEITTIKALWEAMQKGPSGD